MCVYIYIYTYICIACYKARLWEPCNLHGLVNQAYPPGGCILGPLEGVPGYKTQKGQGATAGIAVERLGFVPGAADRTARGIAVARQGRHRHNGSLGSTAPVRIEAGVLTVGLS